MKADIRPKEGLAVRNERGFTLIELILVIVVLAIMAAVAIPKFIDIRGDAKKSAVQGALGGVRSAIANYKATSIAQGGSGAFATVAQLGDGTTVMDGVLPDNPYSTAATKNDVEDVVANTGGAKGTANCGNASAKAWCYRTDNGAFWASTSGSGENAYQPRASGTTRWWSAKSGGSRSASSPS